MGLDRYCVACCKMRGHQPSALPPPPCNWGTVDKFSIEIVRAEALLPLDGVIYKSKVFVELVYPPVVENGRCLPVMDVYGEAVRTRTRDGASPEFRKFTEFRLGPSSPRHLVLLVYSSTDGFFSKSEILLGGCKLDLESVAVKEPSSSCLPLEQMFGSVDTPTGSLSVNVEKVSNVTEQALQVFIGRSWNVPQMDVGGQSDPYVYVEVISDTGSILAYASTRVIYDERNPVWDQVLTVEAPQWSTGRAARIWDPKKTYIRFTIYDHDLGFDDCVGSSKLLLFDFAQQPFMKLLIHDRSGNPVVDTAEPHMPCQLAVGIVAESIPQNMGWPTPSTLESWGPHTYPKHIFMMTRGTRGDVQPFITLARGMAEQQGWLVTICTEQKWKAFVEQHAKVSRGCIRFRDSGGDTEATMNIAIAQWLMRRTLESVQMLILAMSESNFFPSLTVFMSHVLEMDREPKPVDLIVFGLTCSAMAVLISEHCNKKIAGYILQPSIIPSEDPNWTAVQALESHSNFSKEHFTSHSDLSSYKSLVERNPFAMYNIDSMRRWFKLEPADLWTTLAKFKVPLVIPMNVGTFEPPSDWAKRFNTIFTSFIFLRQQQSLKTGPSFSPLPSDLLGAELGGFIQGVKAAGRKLGLMTFSSMPVCRSTVLTCCSKMIEECTVDLSMIFVGSPNPNENVPTSLQDKISSLKTAYKFCEVGRADFAVLFKFIDFFIVQGGLGTTVEALRMGKPILVSGVLLLDQRFWGSVVHGKNCGPEPVHIDELENKCVEFANDAVDPRDPKGYQISASKVEGWGKEEDDGVKTNVDCFVEMLSSGSLQSIQTMCSESVFAAEVPGLGDETDRSVLNPN